MTGAAPGAAVAALFAIAVVCFWSGLGPHDGIAYVNAALAWSENGPVLGETHWALRHLFVLPMAAGFRFFGASEFTAILPNILYAAGLVAITYIYARRCLGAGAGFAAAAFVATSAFFVGLALEVYIFGPEIFFGALAAWLFIEGLQEDAAAPRRAFVLSGLCLGAAWLCREVAIFFVPSFALAAFWRARHPVAGLAAFAGGFAAVLAAELVLYWLVAGDPFYRLTIDFGHNGARSLADLVAPRAGLGAHIAKPVVNLLTYTAVTPFVVAAGLALLSPGLRARLSVGRGRDVVILFGTASVLGFFIASYGLRLNEAHYFPILAYFSLLILGAFWAHLYAARRWLGAAFAGGVLFLNAAAADFHRDGYEEARDLAFLLKHTDESIATDALTAARASLYLRFAGAGKAEAAARIPVFGEAGPPCGLIYVATPKGRTPAIGAQADWREEWRAEARKTPWTHALLRRLGFQRAPSARLREILEPPPPAALYRAPC